VEGHPDQDLLSAKGGRGFPYCAFMDATGNVLYEARPDSAESVKNALNMATLLVSMRAKAAADPKDAASAAAASILAAMGCKQRAPSSSPEELDKLIKTKGLDPIITEAYGVWALEFKVQQVFQNAKSKDDVEEGCYKLFKEAKGEVGTGRMAFAVSIYAAGGAATAGDAAVGKAAIAIARKGLADFPEAQQMQIAAELKKIEDRLAALPKDEKKDN
jgi:hypothetical protein